jgi:hypothetical protein
MFKRWVTTRVRRFQVRHLIFRNYSLPGILTPGRLAPGEVFPVNEQYNIVQPGIQSAQFPTPSLEFSPFFGGPGNSAGVGKTGFSSGVEKCCRFNRPCRRTNRAGAAFVFSVGRLAGCSPRQKEERICIRGRVASSVWGVYANCDGLSCAAHLFVFRNDSKSCYIRIPLVSHWFVIRIYSFFAIIRSHVIFAFRWFRCDSLFASIRFSQWFAVMLYSHSVGFALIRYSHLFVFRNDSQSCYIRIPLVFALIRYSHLFVFRNDSQSCYIRILLVSHWFVICIYSFFAMIRSHVIFAFRWFRIDSLFACIAFFAMIRGHVVFAFRWLRRDSLFASIPSSQWFAVMLYSHFVGFNIVSLFASIRFFRNDSQACYIRLPLVSQWSRWSVAMRFAPGTAGLIFSSGVGVNEKWHRIVL